MAKDPFDEMNYDDDMWSDLDTQDFSFSGDFDNDQKSEDKEDNRSPITKHLKSVGKDLVSAGDAAATGAAVGIATKIGREFPEVRNSWRFAMDGVAQAARMRDDILKEIRPTVNEARITTKKFLQLGDTILPNAGLFKKLDQLIGEPAVDDRVEKVDIEETRSQAIAGELSQMFAVQSQERSLERKQATIERLIDKRESRANQAQLTSILGDIRTDTFFNASFLRSSAVAYMKKSLELKYRHFYLAQDTLEALKLTTKSMEERLDAIKHNTGLPEAQKIYITERVKNISKERLSNAISDHVTNLFDNVRKKAMEDYITPALENASTILEQLSFGVDAVEQAKEMGISNRDMATDQAGGFVGGILGSRIGQKFIDRLPINVRRTIRDAASVGPTELLLMLNRLRNGTFDWKDEKDHTLISQLAELLPEINKGHGVYTNTGYAESDKAGVITNRFIRTVEEIIPRYLSLQTKYLEQLATGNPAEAQIWDWKTNGFMRESELQATLSERVFGKDENRRATQLRTADHIRSALKSVRYTDAPDDATATAYSESIQRSFETIAADMSLALLNLAHARFSTRLDIDAIEAVANGDSVDSSYFSKVFFNGIKNPRGMAQVLLRILKNPEGRVNNSLVASIAKRVKELIEQLEYESRTLQTEVLSKGYGSYFEKMSTTNRGDLHIADEDYLDMFRNFSNKDLVSGSVSPEYYYSPNDKDALEKLSNLAKGIKGVFSDMGLFNQMGSWRDQARSTLVKAGVSITGKTDKEIEAAFDNIQKSLASFKGSISSRLSKALETAKIPFHVALRKINEQLMKVEGLGPIRTLIFNDDGTLRDTDATPEEIKAVIDSVGTLGIEFIEKILTESDIGFWCLRETLYADPRWSMVLDLYKQQMRDKKQRSLEEKALKERQQRLNVESPYIGGRIIERDKETGKFKVKTAKELSQLLSYRADLSMDDIDFSDLRDLTTSKTTYENIVNETSDKRQNIDTSLINSYNKSGMITPYTLEEIVGTRLDKIIEIIGGVSGAKKTITPEEAEELQKRVDEKSRQQIRSTTISTPFKDLSDQEIVQKIMGDQWIHRHWKEGGIRDQALEEKKQILQDEMEKRAAARWDKKKDIYVDGKLIERTSDGKFIISSKKELNAVLRSVGGLDLTKDIDATPYIESISKQMGKQLSPEEFWEIIESVAKKNASSYLAKYKKEQQEYVARMQLDAASKQPTNVEEISDIPQYRGQDIERAEDGKWKIKSLSEFRALKRQKPLVDLRDIDTVYLLEELQKKKSDATESDVTTLLEQENTRHKNRATWAYRRKKRAAADATLQSMSDIDRKEMLQWLADNPNASEEDYAARVENDDKQSERIYELFRRNGYKAITQEWSYMSPRAKRQMMEFLRSRIPNIDLYLEKKALLQEEDAQQRFQKQREEFNERKRVQHYQQRGRERVANVFRQYAPEPKQEEILEQQDINEKARGGTIDIFTGNDAGTVDKPTLIANGRALAGEHGVETVVPHNKTNDAIRAYLEAKAYHEGNTFATGGTLKFSSNIDESIERLKAAVDDTVDTFSKYMGIDESDSDWMTRIEHMRDGWMSNLGQLKKKKSPITDREVAAFKNKSAAPFQSVIDTVPEIVVIPTTAVSPAPSSQFALSKETNERIGSTVRSVSDSLANVAERTNLTSAAEFIREKGQNFDANEVISYAQKKLTAVFDNLKKLTKEDTYKTLWKNIVKVFEAAEDTSVAEKMNPDDRSLLRRIADCIQDGDYRLSKLQIPEETSNVLKRVIMFYQDKVREDMDTMDGSTDTKEMEATIFGGLQTRVMKSIRDFSQREQVQNLWGEAKRFGSNVKDTLVNFPRLMMKTLADLFSLGKEKMIDVIIDIRTLLNALTLKTIGGKNFELGDIPKLNIDTLAFQGKLPMSERVWRATKKGVKKSYSAAKWAVTQPFSAYRHAFTNRQVEVFARPPAGDRLRRDRDLRISDEHWAEGIYTDPMLTKRCVSVADIRGIVYDAMGNPLLTESDLERGLVDGAGKPLRNFGSRIGRAFNRTGAFIGEKTWNAAKWGFNTLANTSIMSSAKSMAGMAMTAAMTPVNIARGFIQKYKDVYLKDNIAAGPLVTAKELRNGFVVFSDGSPVKDVYSIDRPVQYTEDPANGELAGQWAITNEHLRIGLVDKQNKPLNRFGTQAGSLLRHAGDKIASMIRVAGGGVGTVLSWGLDVAKSGGKKLFEKKNPFIDVYDSKGKLLILGRDIRDGKYVFADGRPVKSAYEIAEEVYDRETNNLAITNDDIREGLRDFDGHKLTKWRGRSIAFKAATFGFVAGKWALSKAWKMLKSVGSKTGNKLSEWAQAGASILDYMHTRMIEVVEAFKSSRPATAQDLETIVGSRLDKMLEIMEKGHQLALEDAAASQAPKILGDKDGDGDRDNSYEDQMQKKKEREKKRQSATKINIPTLATAAASATSSKETSEENGGLLNDLANAATIWDLVKDTSIGRKVGKLFGGVKSVGSKIGGGLKNMGGAIGRGVSKILPSGLTRAAATGAAATAATTATSATTAAAGTLGTVGSVTAGGALATGAARAAARGALRAIGTRAALAAAGFIPVVGQIAMGAGLLYTGYELASWIFSDSKAVTSLKKVRFDMYGVDTDYEDEIESMEQEVIKIAYNQRGALTDDELLNYAEDLDFINPVTWKFKFGFSTADQMQKDYLEYFKAWFQRRFGPMVQICYGNLAYVLGKKPGDPLKWSEIDKIKNDPTKIAIIRKMISEAQLILSQNAFPNKKVTLRIKDMKPEEKSYNNYLSLVASLDTKKISEKSGKQLTNIEFDRREKEYWFIFNGQKIVAKSKEDIETQYAQCLHKNKMTSQINRLANEKTLADDKKQQAQQTLKQQNAQEALRRQESTVDTKPQQDLGSSSSATAQSAAATVIASAATSKTTSSTSSASTPMTSSSANRSMSATTIAAITPAAGVAGTSGSVTGAVSSAPPVDLSNIPPSAQAPKGDVNALGSFVSKYESGNKGSAAIGYDREGGTSYGTYQLSSRRGSLKEFVAWCQSSAPEVYAALWPYLRSSNTGSTRGDFVNRWLGLVKDGKINYKLEHDYYVSKFFNPSLKRLQKLNPAAAQAVSSNRALQEAYWSTAVQHGPYGTKWGAPGIFSRTFTPGMDVPTYLKAIYTDRGQRFKDPKVLRGVRNRFRQELADMLYIDKTYGSQTQSTSETAAQGGSQTGTTATTGVTTTTSSPATAGVSLSSNIDAAVSRMVGSSGSRSIGSASGAGASGGTAFIPSGPIDKSGMKLAAGVDFDNLHPAVKQRFAAMAKEYKEKTGRPVQVNSGKRSMAKQEELYRKYGPGRAARPNPLSPHIAGVALDANSADMNYAEREGLLQKYGLWRPLKNGLGRCRPEAWHVEIEGSRDPNRKVITEASLAAINQLAAAPNPDPNVGTDKPKISDPSAQDTSADGTKSLSLNEQTRQETAAQGGSQTGTTATTGAPSGGPNVSIGGTPSTTTTSAGDSTTSGASESSSQESSTSSTVGTGEGSAASSSTTSPAASTSPAVATTTSVASDTTASSSTASTSPSSASASPVSTSGSLLSSQSNTGAPIVSVNTPSQTGHVNAPIENNAQLQELKLISQLLSNIRGDLQTYFTRNTEKQETKQEVIASSTDTSNATTASATMPIDQDSLRKALTDALLMVAQSTGVSSNATGSSSSRGFSGSRRESALLAPLDMRKYPPTAM